MISSLPRLLVTALFISLLASACGGGGSGGGNTTPPAPAPDPDPHPAPPQHISISGTVTATDSQAVDGDTNDPNSAPTPNDSVASAQPIGNPITLGGYVNQPGTGADGRSQQSGDVDDYFRVELLAGQTVTMLVADYQQADIDLYLYDTENNILDSSVEAGEIESLVIPADGTYVVNAFALAGASNYILAIGTHNEIASHSRQHDNIVPWQTVVKYKDDSATSHSHGEVSRRLGMVQRAGGPGRGRLLALRRALAGAPELSSRLGPAAAKREHISNADQRARWETLLAIKALRRDPRVAYAEPNYKIRAWATPDDEALPFQWHYPLIDLPAAWDTTSGDPGVVIAVVDTGILSDHPDLRGQLVSGYDFIRDPDSAGDGDGIDPNPEDPGSVSGPGSSSFHGTHVSGTVAAAGNNGLGVAGVAYSARIMPLRALDSGGAGTSYDVNQAVRFAAGLPNDSGTLPQQPATIINLSLGGGSFSQASQDLYNQVRAAGITVVAAAGNEGSPTPAYPASYDNVISVSAVDAQGRLTSYSNRGARIDVAAPGGDNGVDINGDGYPDGVLSTGGSGGGAEISFAYTFLSGTSMAAPHVAGVVALMKSVNPDLSPRDIDALLAGGEMTEDLGTVGRDDAYGHGLINAQRAVLAALEAGGSSPADNPRLSASASTLSFGTSSNLLNLELRNAGKGELELLELAVSETWLQVTPVTAGDDGLGRYQVAVDRGDLPSGVYAGNIIARSSVNNLSVRVIMSVAGEGISADVGVLYILLYEPASDEAIAQFATTARDGEYRFNFDSIPPGQYELIAGPDADNDQFICDPGEACGAWLTVDQPILIDLDDDVAAVNFPVEYLVSLPNLASGTGDSTPSRRQRSRSAVPIAKGELHKDH